MSTNESETLFLVCARTGLAKAEAKALLGKLPNEERAKLRDMNGPGILAVLNEHRPDQKKAKAKKKAEAKKGNEQAAVLPAESDPGKAG